MNLGRVELCLNVKDLTVSLEFYHKLGFVDLEIYPEEGWGILQYRDFVLGLYQGHIKENLLNFRGGNIYRLKDSIEKCGLQMEKWESVNEDGTGSIFMRDPDNNLLYLDTSPGELED